MKPALAVGVALSLVLSGGKINSTSDNTAQKNFYLKTYSLNSKTLSELNEEMEKIGPKDQFGSSHHAYSKWDISWNWPTENNKPNYKKASVKLDITLTLPSWAKFKSSEELLAWNRYSTAMIGHELNHIKAAQEAADEILKLIQSLPNETDSKIAKMHIQSRLDLLRGFDVEYDHRTLHGYSEGVSLSNDYQNNLNSIFSVLSSRPWMEPK